MSTYFLKSVVIADETGDEANFTSVPLDEMVDWTDDTEAVLANVKIGAQGTPVFINRADLRSLRDFLSDLLEADAILFDVNEDEDDE